ncbi:hypothetical protein D030_3229B, partial [Vibrio parahaemolyticus AQ3810]
LGFLLEK